MPACYAKPDLCPPDITEFAAGNTGIPYVWSFAAEPPGPHAVLVAILHGNEPCGAVALTRLLGAGVRPVRGRLTLIFANVEAYRRFDPQQPERTRFLEEDMNRVWSRATLTGPRRSLELDRAREILPVIETADLLLDLHSMRYGAEPLLLSGMVPAGVALSRAMAAPRRIVMDLGHAAGPRLRDFEGFSEPGGKAAVLVECGQHWRSEAAEFADWAARRFLAVTGMVEADVPLPATAEPQEIIEVTEAITATSHRFGFTERFRGLEVIRSAGTVIGYDGERPIRTPYDNCLLIMPCERIAPGHTAVRLGRLIA